MQKELVEFCQKHEIAVVAYCPLGRPGASMGGRPSIMETDIIKSICARVERSPAQVLLQWGLARGVSVIPKTGNKKTCGGKPGVRRFRANRGRHEGHKLARL